MQHTLSFSVGDRKYVSRVFDFEAMCIINDAHNDDTKNGPLNICKDALLYMFEGTEATEDIIKQADVSVLTDMCLKLWGFYAEALSSKKA